MTEIAKAQQSGSGLQQGSILHHVADQLSKPMPGGHLYIAPEVEEALLTQWGELFRTGLLAWGRNLSNPESPNFHMTERGKRALANVTRDPSNPLGYLRHLNTKAPGLNPIAQSYLQEALECYVSGLFKAGAVMVGAAAESLIIELAEAAKQRIQSLGGTVPKGLSEWKLKSVLDALRNLIAVRRSELPDKLREAFEANWSAFIQQIRATRNDAGHPSSIDPITPDTLHASLLVFPELAQTCTDLKAWITNHLL